jgi:lipoprotein-anchoring transpeptidase ErfK/SrfK
MTPKLSRRDFLKLAGLGLGALALRPFDKLRLPQFPGGDRLGRVLFATDVMSQPNFDAPVLGRLYEDTIVEWNRETVSSYRNPNVFNQRWVETPQGFIYSPNVQPVRYLPNTPLDALPAGETGFWADVTVPYVDLNIANPPIRSPWAKTVMETRGINPRLYYGQVVWIDQVKNENGVVYYRFNEDFGHGYGYGDMFWVEAAALRPLTEEEVAPISPEVDPATKRIVVNINYQTFSCFEGNTEVYFCRTSTGLLESQVQTDKYQTPVGDMYAWRKMPSIAMGANSQANAAGYDTPAVPWTTFVAAGGVAIHGAFWHNNFGTPRSHGCINLLPQDAKWVWRWTTPHVSLKQSEVQLTWPEVGTKVTSIHRLFT